MKKVSILLSILFMLFGASSALTAPVTLDGLTFSEVTGDFTITGGSFDGTVFTIYEDVFGLDVTMEIEGLSSYGNQAGIGFHANGIWLEKIVTNSTGQDWNFYDHELQSVLGVASTDGDGLSFAQGTASARPWISDKFASFDEVVDVRDYINFYDGTVAAGETVSFYYAITHNGSADPVYLRQRPNYSTQVPEPSTVLLFGTGLIGVLGICRKKIIK